MLNVTKFVKDKNKLFLLIFIPLTSFAKDIENENFKNRCLFDEHNYYQQVFDENDKTFFQFNYFLNGNKFITKSGYIFRNLKKKEQTDGKIYYFYEICKTNFSIK